MHGIGIPSRKQALAAAAALLVLVVSTACIRSRAVIRSEPSDARVTVNYIERGHTPIEIPVIWYWWYKIQLEKEGYRPLERDERFWAPPWAVLPFDLLAEAVPVPIPNTYRRDYVLEPLERRPAAPAPLPALTP